MMNLTDLTYQQQIALHLELTKLDIQHDNIMQGHLSELPTNLQQIYDAEIRGHDHLTPSPEEPSSYTADATIEAELDHERQMDQWRRKNCLMAYADADHLYPDEKLRDIIKFQIRHWLADEYGEVPPDDLKKSKPRLGDTYPKSKEHLDENYRNWSVELFRELRLPKSRIYRNGISPKSMEGQYAFRAFRMKVHKDNRYKNGGYLLSKAASSGKASPGEGSVFTLTEKRT